MISCGPNHTLSFEHCLRTCLNLLWDFDEFREASGKKVELVMDDIEL